MRRLRFWIIITGVWLTFFFNIERILFDEVSANIIRSDTYIFVTIVALIPLLLPRLNTFYFSMLLVFVAALFLFVWYQDPRWNRGVASSFTHSNASTLLTIIQVNAIILTGLLARQIAFGLSEFEDVIADITYGHIGKRPTPFAENQSEMYREVRRAARYGRPLAMIALRIDTEILQVPLPQMVVDVQKAMMKEFTLAGIGRTLDKNLLGFNTIALRDNYFIVTMPETKADEIPIIAQRLEKIIKEKMNVPLQVGTASFPDEAITFESLVELAVAHAEQQPKSQIIPEHKQQAVAQEM